MHDPISSSEREQLPWIAQLSRENPELRLTDPFYAHDVQNLHAVTSDRDAMAFLCGPDGLHSNHRNQLLQLQDVHQRLAALQSWKDELEGKNL